MGLHKRDYFAKTIYTQYAHFYTLLRLYCA